MIPSFLAVVKWTSNSLPSCARPPGWRPHRSPGVKIVGLASDVGAGAGPYTKVLTEEIVKPGIEAIVMFHAVQRCVQVAVSQERYLSFHAIGDMYFGNKPDLSPATPDPLLRVREAEQAWTSAMDMTCIVAIEDFVARYQDTS